MLTTRVAEKPPTAAPRMLPAPMRRSSLSRSVAEARHASRLETLITIDSRITTVAAAACGTKLDSSGQLIVDDRTASSGNQAVALVVPVRNHPSPPPPMTPHFNSASHRHAAKQEYEPEPRAHFARCAVPRAGWLQR